MKKKIVYLHGLESKPGGKKVEYLKEKYEVFAPSMDYKTNPNLFKEILQKIKDFDPDVIVGSSAGGYFAHHYCTILCCTGILFNPAIHSRSIELNVETGNYTPYQTVILGNKDKVIKPIPTVEYFKYEYKGYSEIFFHGHGHRTPFDIFTSYL